MGRMSKNFGAKQVGREDAGSLDMTALEKAGTFVSCHQIIRFALHGHCQ